MSTPTRLDPVINPVTTLNAADYMEGDGTDETAGFRELFAARAAIAGDVAIRFPEPPVSYHIVSDSITGAHPAVVGEVPGGTLIYGDGKGNTDGTGIKSTIYWTGVEKKNDFNDVGHSSRQLIWKFTDKSRVLIRDLRIVGDNGVFEAGYVRYNNNQSTPIDIAHAAGATVARGMVIRDVGFYNLVGYAGHTTGAYRLCSLIRCDFQFCANGPNFNAGHIVYFQNKFNGSEGIEAAGRPGVVALNDGAALSIGGTNTQNLELPGVIVVGNTRKTTGGGSSDVNIIAAECYTDGWIQGNVIEAETGDCIDVGATVGREGTYLYDRCTIVNNRCTGRRGVGLQESQDHLVADNDLTGSNLSAFALAEAVGSDFRGNTLHGSVIINGLASDIGWENNTFASGALVDTGHRTVNKPAPTGVETKLFGNVSDGFATLQIRNWPLASTVSVDFSGSGLAPGDGYALYHPFDLLGAPYATGTYTGSNVSVPMHSVSPPDDWEVGTDAPLPDLGPKFHAFMLERVTAASSPCLSPEPG